MGPGQQPPRAGEIRGAEGARAGLSAGAGAVHPGPVRRRRSRASRAGAHGHHRRLAGAVLAQHLHPPAPEELADFQPDYVILHAPHFQTDPAIDGVRSGTSIALSFEQRIIVIAGSEYAGEVKKSIFTVMNWILPDRGVMPMHCSANIGGEGDVALFFGLSGTGKTTLSSDPHRKLIGDDEHGWSENGVFNFEGGCYAKVINLSAEHEPEIWAASHRFGTVLENVVADAHGRLDLTDQSLTENTRSAYPVEYIPNIEPSLRGGQPRNVVMLTCDAFGVMPPIAKLTPAQAMYHFLSGYTALVAGTEKGLGAEPQATFSTCFGAPFLPRRPEVYGRMLAELIARHEADCWLVNTGWSGGQYGVGQRMSIRHTRALLRAALDGSLARTRFRKERFFGLAIPEHVPGVPAEVLDPREAWADKAAYDRMAQRPGRPVREELRRVRGRRRRRGPGRGDPRGRPEASDWTDPIGLRRALSGGPPRWQPCGPVRDQETPACTSPRCSRKTASTCCTMRSAAPGWPRWSR